MIFFWLEPESFFKALIQFIKGLRDTVCARSSDKFYIVTYYMKWVTTSWTYSIFALLRQYNYDEKTCTFQ